MSSVCESVCVCNYSDTSPGLEMSVAAGPVGPLYFVSLHTYTETDKEDLGANVDLFVECRDFSFSPSIFLCVVSMLVQRHLKLTSSRERVFPLEKAYQ